jgi:hypothetical protein
MVETWIDSRRDADGLLHVKSGKTGGVAAMRFVAVDSATVRFGGNGALAEEVRLRDLSGGEARARIFAAKRRKGAVSINFELLRPLALPPKDAGRAVGQAVMRYVKSGSQNGGEFSVADDPSPRKRKLRLKELPADAEALDGNHFRLRAFFKDVDDGSNVGVDFLVRLAGDEKRVYKASFAAAP